MSIVKTPIVRIGNSRGIRIPKVLIDQVGLGDEVEISVQRDRLIIRPSSRPRHGWDKQFRAMAERGDDRLLDEPVSSAVPPILTEMFAGQGTAVMGRGRGMCAAH